MIVDGPTNGTATVDPVTGEVTYTPNPDYNGPDTVTYQICDTTPVPLCDSATIAITVDPINDPPIANSDVVATPEDTPVVIDVVANDTDVDGNLDPTTVTIISGPGNGTATVDPVTGEITYTPGPNYSGPDSFTYQVCDTDGECSVTVAAVSTTVVEIDDPPVADDDAATTDEDTPVTVDVVANDSDVDGNLDPTSVTILAGPSNGTATVDPVSGEVTYLPDPDYNGPDTITYQICDTSPTPLCDTATITLTVNPIDDPPVANPDSATTPEDTPVVIDVTANDSDVDGNLDPTTVTIISGPGNGTATVDPVTGEITYTPGPNYSGPDSLTYQVCDTTSPTPLCDTGTVNISVDPVNDAPIHSGPTTIQISVSDKPETLPIVDPEGHSYTVTVIAGPLPAGVSVAGNGTFSGAAATAGTFTVTYRACDDQVPPACSEFTVVYVVSDLPVTGISFGLLAAIGMLLMALGAVLIRGSRRRIVYSAPIDGSRDRRAQILR
jgi:hypothetical protein